MAEIGYLVKRFGALSFVDWAPQRPPLTAPVFEFDFKKNVVVYSQTPIFTIQPFVFSSQGDHTYFGPRLLRP